MRKLEELRQFLQHTARLGDEPAEVREIHQLADGVYCVLDRYKGETHYDVYYDVEAATPLRSPAESSDDSQDDDPGSLGLGLICYGSRHVGVRHVGAHAMCDLLLANDGRWMLDPVSVFARKG